MLFEAWIPVDCFVARLFGNTATWCTYIIIARVIPSAKDEGQNFVCHLCANCILCPPYFVKKRGGGTEFHLSLVCELYIMSPIFCKKRGGGGDNPQNISFTGEARIWLRLTCDVLWGTCPPPCLGYSWRGSCHVFTYHGEPLVEWFETHDSVELKRGAV